MFQRKTRVALSANVIRLFFNLSKKNKKLRSNIYLEFAIYKLRNLEIDESIFVTGNGLGIITIFFLKRSKTGTVSIFFDILEFNINIIHYTLYIIHFQF